MFNHLYNKHNTEFSNSVSKDWLDQAEEDSPLMFWWYYTDDFDEEKQVKLYGCLATKKTFTSEERALLHFKRSPESKKLHNKELAKLKKQVKKNKTANVQPTTVNPIKVALNTKDPRLARALYSRYLYLLPLFKTLLETLSKMYVETWPIFTGQTFGCNSERVCWTLPQIKEKIDYLQDEVDKLITKKELDPQRLYNLNKDFDKIILTGRVTLDEGSSFCNKRYETDEVGLIVPTDEFYVGNPAYPQVDF